MPEVHRVLDANWEGVLPLLQQYLAEIGEPPLDEAGAARVGNAIATDRIRFFAAHQDGRTVGICSLTFAWSTFAGGAPVGTLEDVYVAVEHRRRGIARVLVEQALAEAVAEGCSSVVVGCSEDDVAMYRSLGFSTRLGALLARILPSR